MGICTHIKPVYYEKKTKILGSEIWPMIHLNMEFMPLSSFTGCNFPLLGIGPSCWPVQKFPKSEQNIG